MPDIKFAHSYVNRFVLFIIDFLARIGSFLRQSMKKLSHSLESTHIMVSHGQQIAKKEEKLVLAHKKTQD